MRTSNRRKPGRCAPTAKNLGARRDRPRISAPKAGAGRLSDIEVWPVRMSGPEFEFEPMKEEKP